MTTVADTARTGGWLEHVPVPLFAMTMGVGGLGLAWRKAHEVFALPSAIGEGLLLLAGALYAAMAALYAAKAAAHPKAVAAEYAHPVRGNFFAAISISLMILAGGLLPHARTGADMLWLAGAGLQIALSAILVGRWLTREQQIAHSNPAWFIPIVGNVLAPIAGVPLGHGELSWFMFGVGIVFWLVLFPIVLNRILFHGMMPAKLTPTLFILLAPPSVGFLAHVQLNGGTLDGGARLLIAPALFLALILALRAARFLKLPFAVSWWAFTFPSAALALAGLRYAQLAPSPVTQTLAGVLLLAASAIIAAVFGRTLVALLRGDLFLPD